MRITHLASGGTLDSIWDPAADTAKPAKTSVVATYLKDIARSPHEIGSDALFLRDSREIGDEEMRLIADRVMQTTAPGTLVTSGTYLMPDIAKTINEHPSANAFKHQGRKAVVTGALTPMRGFLRSDGGFNLGMSTAVLEEQEHLRADIYVVMNGFCFQAADVRKNLKESSFTSGRQGKDILPLDAVFLVNAGGSIDFVPDGLDGFEPARESIVPRFLSENVRFGRSVAPACPFLEDSRNITPAEQDILADYVRSTDIDNVLITLGIYRMTEIRSFLRRAVRDLLKEKCVVLTGSRIPLSVTDRTDAPFQLGYALGKMPFLPPGVHTALNGRMIGDGTDIIQTVFTPEEVKKLQHMGGGILSKKKQR